MNLKISKTQLPGVLIIEPKVFGDDRGIFFESFNLRNFNLSTNLETNFVQDNHSKSNKAVLRGLHYQIHKPQGKLIRVVEGVIFDVAVDIRKGSPSFGKWIGIELSADNNKQLWVPPDFAHGFLTISTCAQVLYKTTDYYVPEFEYCIRWDDPDLDINWPDIGSNFILSGKDKNGMLLNETELPTFVK